MIEPTHKYNTDRDDWVVRTLRKRQFDRFESDISRYWRGTLFIVVTFINTFSISANFLLRSRPYIGPDAVLFEYSGWYATQGGLPYLALWDPKPPLVHEIATGLAVLTDGNVGELHLLSSLLMALASIVVVLLVAELAFSYTDDELAAFTAGFAMLTYPVFYLMPMGGLRPKMFVLLFGLLSIYLLDMDRPLAAGITSAAAAGAWQFGVFFPLLVAIQTARQSPNRFGRSVVGMGFTTVIVVYPFVLQNVTSRMLSQVVVSMFVASEPLQFVERIIVGAGALDFAIPIVVLGATGTLLTIRYRSGYWILAGLAWFGVQVFFFDLDGGADLVPAFAFVALGIGFLTQHVSASRARQVLGITVVIGGVMFWWHGGLSGFVPPQTPLEPRTVKWLYWQQELPLGCHIRMSEMERQFIEKTGAQVSERFCDGAVMSPFF